MASPLDKAVTHKFKNKWRKMTIDCVGGGAMGGPEQETRIGVILLNDEGLKSSIYQ